MEFEMDHSIHRPAHKSPESLKRIVRAASEVSPVIRKGVARKRLICIFVPVGPRLIERRQPVRIRSDAFFQPELPVFQNGPAVGEASAKTAKRRLNKFQFAHAGAETGNITEYPGAEIRVSRVRICL